MDTGFPCQVCPKSFASKSSLRHHTYTHNETEEVCNECGEVFSTKKKLYNHKRKHGEREKAKVVKCDHCPYESTGFNVKRHLKTSHNLSCDECGIPTESTKSLKNHKRLKHHAKSCVVCGLSFTRSDNLKRHLRTHQDKQNLENATKIQKMERKTEFCCETCGFKTKRKSNLERHMRQAHMVRVRKTKASKQRQYRRRVKFLKDVQNAAFAKRMEGSSGPALDETDIEHIMASRPNMSNRDVAAFLKILRKKLPAKTFSMNVKKAMEKRTNLLKAYFRNDDSLLVGYDGDEVERPITVASDLNNLVSFVCSKREIKEDECKVVMGVDGGQGKIIVTASIIPDNEKDGSERAKEANQKDRFKSTGAKRTMVIARVDDVPECYENLEIVLKKLELPNLGKEFALVCDVKLIDILTGLQGCSAMYPCPYCLGCKVDEKGKSTNQRGTWQKGPPRTFRNLKEEFEKSMTKHKNGKMPSRNTLKKYHNVKHLPIQVRDDQLDIPISKLYPPPQLHCGILGRGKNTKLFCILKFPPLQTDFHASFVLPFEIVQLNNTFRTCKRRPQEA